jgi:transcriptional regulator
VPTSYYAAVQLACEIESIDDDAAVAKILDKQLDHFQPEGKHAPVEPGENRYAKQFGAIRGLRLTVTDVRAKFKFGGNRTPQHRDAVAKNLDERGGLLDREARSYTLTRGNKPKP